MLTPGRPNCHNTMAAVRDLSIHGRSKTFVNPCCIALMEESVSFFFDSLWAEYNHTISQLYRMTKSQFTLLWCRKLCAIWTGIALHFCSNHMRFTPFFLHWKVNLLHCVLQTIFGALTRHPQRFTWIECDCDAVRETHRNQCKSCTASVCIGTNCSLKPYAQGASVWPLSTPEFLAGERVLKNAVTLF